SSYSPTGPVRPDTGLCVARCVGRVGGVGTIAGQDLFRTYILSYSDLYVPANARVEFDVSCDVYFSIDGGGSCEFLAAGNGRQVAAPGVFVTMQPWIIT